jgi:polysaccharide deacetylase 2 family uncharacterized protein YibQ
MHNIAAILITACIANPGPPIVAPEIAIVIDDIGYDSRRGRAAIELTKPFAYAVLPFAPFAKKLANLAHQQGKDVILHLPMEAEQDNHLLGPGALRVNMSELEVRSIFAKSLAAVPHAIGVNNHMGSRLTTESKSLNWLMQSIHDRRNLFFLDSRTTKGSLALSIARAARIPATSRDVFLDTVQSRDHVEGQLQLLIKRAKKNGHALGIAHPYDVTISALAQWRPKHQGVNVVKLSDYMDRYAHRIDRSTPLRSRQTTSFERCDQGDHSAATEYPHAQRERSDQSRRLH